MVDLPESSPREIRRSFTQQALLDRAAALLAVPVRDNNGTVAGSEPAE
jgi:hypothetical protein